MKKNFNDVKSLFEELDYYEKKGFYKLSDQVLTKIQRYAWNMNWESVFSGAIKDKLEATKFQQACEDFPECRPYFCNPSGGIKVAKDFYDYIISERKKNPNAKIEELHSNFGMGATPQLQTLVEDIAGNEDAFQRCMAKMGLQSPFNPKGKLGEGENLVAQDSSGLNPGDSNKSTTQQSSPNRQLMPPL